MSFMGWLERTLGKFGPEDTIDRLQKSVDVLHAIMARRIRAFRKKCLSNAKCIMSYRI